MYTHTRGRNCPRLTRETNGLCRETSLRTSQRARAGKSWPVIFQLGRETGGNCAKARSRGGAAATIYALRSISMPRRACDKRGSFRWPSKSGIFPLLKADIYPAAKFSTRTRVCGCVCVCAHLSESQCFSYFFSLRMDVQLDLGKKFILKKSAVLQRGNALVLVLPKHREWEMFACTRGEKHRCGDDYSHHCIQSNAIRDFEKTKNSTRFSSFFFLL